MNLAETASSIGRSSGAHHQPSIAALEPVQLDGVDQWITVRGASIDLPLLLFLSGGPGFSELARLRHFNSCLEKHFLVIGWDQRGSGKSFQALDPLHPPTLKDYLSDARQLVEILRRRFSQQRLFLVGHSWGSILGALLVSRDPQLFRAYLGVGQQVNTIQNDIDSYQWALGMAITNGPDNAKRELLDIGPPPYHQQTGSRFRILTDWLEYYGAYGGETFIDETYHVIDTAPEYDGNDRNNIHRGMWRTFDLVYPQLFDLDLKRLIERLSLPVYLFHGTNDYVTLLRYALEWFEGLEAPKKRFFSFPGAGHSPNFECSIEFNDILVNTVLKECP